MVVNYCVHYIMVASGLQALEGEGAKSSCGKQGMILDGAGEANESTTIDLFGKC
jgi:hypothetical protein